MIKRTLIAAALSATTLSSPALATEYVTGYVGLFDLVDGDNEATQFGAEYRFEATSYGLRPMIGANITTDGSLYGYGGFNWDVALIDDQLYLIPNFAVGAYSQGDGKDLGHGLEFRSGIEMSYQLPNTHRVGVAFNHVSNASIGDKNPGAETLLINYSVPAGMLFGN
ncbi:MAG: acyloxyacyl hydrolase [Rickettsiales bacterium]